MPSNSTGGFASRAWSRLVPAAIGRRLDGRPLLRLLVQNAGWLIADKLVRLGLGVVTSVWIARYLGPSQFGVFTFGQALVLLYFGGASLGLPDVVLRDLVRHPDRRAAIAASAFVLRMVGAALGLLAIAATALATHPRDPFTLLLCLVFGVSLFPLAFDTVDSSFQATNTVRVIVVARDAVFLVVSLARVVALVVHAPMIVFAYFFTIETTLAGMLVFFVGRLRGRAFRLRDAKFAEMKRLLHESWPLCLRLIFVGIYMRVDQVLVQHMLGDRALGIYSAAARVSEIWYFVPTSAVIALMPSLTQHYQNSPHVYEEKLTQVMRYVVWTSIVAAACISLGANLIVGLLYGSKYLEAGAVLAVHAWVGIFVAIGYAGSTWFVNTGKLRFGLYQSIAVAIISLLANVLLIPRLGVVGAAFAALISQAFSGVLLNVFHPSTRRLFVLQVRAVAFR